MSWQVEKQDLRRHINQGMLLFCASEDRRKPADYLSVKHLLTGQDLSSALTTTSNPLPLQPSEE